MELTVVCAQDFIQAGIQYVLVAVGQMNFKDKHPSCGFLTCCVTRNGLEVCSGCNEYPCKRFDPEKEGYDSFVTHRRIFVNLDSIKEYGIDSFITRQKIRIDILREFIYKFDDGRSKNFFCLGCALLPLDKLQELYVSINSEQINRLSVRNQNKLLKD